MNTNSYGSLLNLDNLSYNVGLHNLVGYLSLLNNNTQNRHDDYSNMMNSNYLQMLCPNQNYQNSGVNTNISPELIQLITRFSDSNMNINNQNLNQMLANAMQNNQIMRENVGILPNQLQYINNNAEESLINGLKGKSNNLTNSLFFENN